MAATAPKPIVDVGDLRKEHLAEVVRIDELHTGDAKPEYWRGVFGDFVGGGTEPLRVGLAAESQGVLIGYLLGEVRAFEFGSEACGWVFAVGIDQNYLHGGVASALLEEAGHRFRAAGVARMRTMVERNSVEVLAFFRANGFVGGSFVQLERDLEEGT